jgi:hypothetical protein
MELLCPLGLMCFPLNTISKVREQSEQPPVCVSTPRARGNLHGDNIDQSFPFSLPAASMAEHLKEYHGVLVAEELFYICEEGLEEGDSQC